VKTQQSMKPDEIVTSIRLSQDEHAFLKALAESQQRSVSGQIRFMVAQLRAAEPTDVAA
jgi:hypothetical protein